MLCLFQLNWLREIQIFESFEKKSFLSDFGTHKWLFLHFWAKSQILSWSRAQHKIPVENDVQIDQKNMKMPKNKGEGRN